MAGVVMATHGTINAPKVIVTPKGSGVKNP